MPAGIPTAVPTVLAPEISEVKVSEKVRAVMVFFLEKKRGEKGLCDRLEFSFYFFHAFQFNIYL